MLVYSIDPFTLSFLRYGLTGLILFLLSITTVYMNKKFAKADLITYVFSWFGYDFTLFPNFMALGLEHTTACKSRVTLCYYATYVQ